MASYRLFVSIQLKPSHRYLCFFFFFPWNFVGNYGEIGIQIYIFYFKKSRFGLNLCCLGLFVWFFGIFNSLKGILGTKFNFSWAKFKFMYNTSALFSCWAGGEGGGGVQWPPGPNIALSLLQSLGIRVI